MVPNRTTHHIYFIYHGFCSQVILTIQLRYSVSSISSTLYAMLAQCSITMPPQNLWFYVFRGYRNGTFMELKWINVMDW